MIHNKEKTQVNYTILKRRLNINKKQYLICKEQTGEIVWQDGMDPKRPLKNFQQESLKFNQQTKDFLPYVPVYLGINDSKVKIRTNKGVFMIYYNGKQITDFKKISSQARLQIIRQFQSIFNFSKVNLQKSQELESLRKLIKH